MTVKEKRETITGIGYPEEHLQIKEQPVDDVHYWSQFYKTLFMVVIYKCS
jgi:hypothetical protein